MAQSQATISPPDFSPWKLKQAGPFKEGHRRLLFAHGSENLTVDLRLYPAKDVPGDCFVRTRRYCLRYAGEYPAPVMGEVEALAKTLANWAEENPKALEQATRRGLGTFEDWQVTENRPLTQRLGIRVPFWWVIPLVLWALMLRELLRQPPSLASVAETLVVAGLLFGLFRYFSPWGFDGDEAALLFALAHPFPDTGFADALPQVMLLPLLWWVYHAFGVSGAQIFSITSYSVVGGVLWGVARSRTSGMGWPGYCWPPLALLLWLMAPMTLTFTGYLRGHVCSDPLLLVLLAWAVLSDRPRLLALTATALVANHPLGFLPALPLLWQLWRTAPEREKPFFVFWLGMGLFLAVLTGVGYLTNMNAKTITQLGGAPPLYFWAITGGFAALGLFSVRTTVRLLALASALVPVVVLMVFSVQGAPWRFSERLLVAWWPFLLALWTALVSGEPQSPLGKTAQLQWVLLMGLVLLTAWERFHIPVLRKQPQTFLWHWLKAHPGQALVLSDDAACYEIRTGLKPPSPGQSPFATHWLDLCSQPRGVHGQMRRQPPAQGPYLLAYLRLGTQSAANWDIPTKCEPFRQQDQMAYFLCQEK